jgi:cytochrome c553
MKIRFILFTIVSLIIFGCEKNPITYDCTGLAPTYTTDVKPILDASCAKSGCHNANSKAKGLDYSSYAVTKANATDEEFMGSMQHLKGYDAMPKGAAQLSEVQLRTISCWIENGLKE